jgi:hypothetical protein
MGGTRGDFLHPPIAAREVVKITCRAQLLLTSDALVADLPKEEKKFAAGGEDMY